MRNIGTCNPNLMQSVIKVDKIVDSDSVKSQTAGSNHRQLSSAAIFCNAEGQGKPLKWIHAILAVPATADVNIGLNYQENAVAFLREAPRIDLRIGEYRSMLNKGVESPGVLQLYATGSSPKIPDYQARGRD